VTSRYRPDIEKWLQADTFHQKINLELNSTHISHAVNAFIDAKVSELAISDDNELQRKVKNYLLENSEETFLWVSLVCKRLEVVPLWKMQLQLTEVLGEFPPGLEQLYERMMNQIENGESAKFCKQILSSITLTLRPIHLKELVTTAGLQEELLYDLQLVRELVDLCSSFLTLQEEMVYFVHQSAKDYFSTCKGERIFHSGQADGHCEIMCRSLEVMSRTLKRDICGLQMPGVLLSEVESDINKNPLTHIQYACCYWISHLCLAGQQHHQLYLSDCGKVHTFLQKHFLHWLEALSLIGEMSKGVLMITDLQSMLTVNDSAITL